MDKKRIIIIVVLFTVILSCIGGTMAYLQWETSVEQRSEVVFSVDADYTCAVDGGGDITASDVVLAPTTCTNSKYAIKREVKVMPTVYDERLGVVLDLWLDINDLGTGLSDSQNFRYALTTSDTSCTDGLVSGGTFNGKTTGDKIELLSLKFYPITTIDTYYLYIWLDEVETSLSTMNQTVNLSFNGSCSNDPEVIPPKQTAYAVYSEDDTSLRFYRSEDEITQGSIYNGLTATAVYTGFEDTEYSSSSDVPWSSYSSIITNVVVEDEISPISTAFWFSEFLSVSSIDVTNLNTSNVVSMSNMFMGAGFKNTVLQFTIVGLDDFDTSNVTNMNGIFYGVGYYASDWSIGDLSDWNTKKIIDMESMFQVAGYSSDEFNIGNLSSWDVSNVTSMSMMFRGAGASAATWNVGDLSGWNVSNVTSMSYMFDDAGYNATYSLDLSGWNVSKVTYHTDFNTGVEGKITPPVWVN